MENEFPPKSKIITVNKEKFTMKRDIKAMLDVDLGGEKLEVYNWLSVPENESSGILYLRSLKDSTQIVNTINSVQLTQPDLWVRVYVSSRGQNLGNENKYNPQNYPRVDLKRYKRDVKWTELTNCIIYDIREDMKRLKPKNGSPPLWVIADASTLFMENNWLSKVKEGKLNATYENNEFHTNFWAGDISIIEKLGMLEEIQYNNRQGINYLNRAMNHELLVPTDVKLTTRDYKGYPEERLIDKKFALGGRKFIPFHKRRLDSTPTGGKRGAGY